MLNTIWRRKWLVIVPVVLSVVTTAVMSYVMPTRYRSDTLILVVPQRVPENYVQSTTSARVSERLQTISQQILSRTRLERVIRDFDLYADERRSGVMEDNRVERMREDIRVERMVERMREDIQLQIVKGDAFRVSYVGNDPRKVMHVTERLSSLFVEESQRYRDVLADGTIQGIMAQSEEKRRELAQFEERTSEFRRINGNRPMPRAMQIEQEVLEETYRTLLTKIEDSKVSANLGDQFRLLDPARLPERPVSPSKVEMNLMGAFAGLGIGFVLVGAASFRRQRT